MAQQLTVLAVLPEVLMPYSGPRAQAHTHTEMHINKNKIYCACHNGRPIIYIPIIGISGVQGQPELQ